MIGLPRLPELDIGHTKIISKTQIYRSTLLQSASVQAETFLQSLEDECPLTLGRLGVSRHNLLSIDTQMSTMIVDLEMISSKVV
jgi:hypothetical protein